ncbi:MAG: hypothetical protein IBX69_00205 [Anaerolineales bacterium]|nr:hypothetical protein [Anaerolineales bacterium]
MTETFTFTARDADNPDEVITFTLKGNFLFVSMTGILEQVDKVRTSQEKGEEVLRQVKTHAKPIALKMIEAFSGPVHISDASATMVGEKLVMNVWKRLAGFRLAPLVIIINRVDNPEASESFVAELNERKKDVTHIGKFFGPLDYWLGWVGLILLVVLLVRWPHRNQ